MGLLKLGNRKLSERIGIFNLPPFLTCPYATSVCRRCCYAMKGYQINRSTMKGRLRRLECSASPDFVERICREIREKGLRVVRIHESGDFYSVEYFLKWCEIARRNPSVLFLAYTRNPEVCRFPRPRNFRLIFSLDMDNWERYFELEGLVDGFSYLLLPGEDIGEIAERLGVERYHVCTDGKCLADCAYCYTARDAFVFFPLH